MADKQTRTHRPGQPSNPVAERFFHTLKVEALSDEPVTSRENTRALVFDTQTRTAIK